MLANTLPKEKNKMNLKYININNRGGALEVRGHKGVGNFQVDRKISLRID